MPLLSIETFRSETGKVLSHVAFLDRRVGRKMVSSKTQKTHSVEPSTRSNDATRMETPLRRREPREQRMKERTPYVSVGFGEKIK